jgi:hypothetical protein
VRAVACRDALDAELDDELAFHLERETEKADRARHVAGGAI